VKIAVLSRNQHLYSTRRLLEAGKKRGHEMIVIDHTKCYMVNDKGKPSVNSNGQQLEDIDAIIPRIGASVTFYGAAVIRQFEMCNVFTTLRSVALTRSRDKLRSMQIMSKAGIGIPKTAFAKHPNDIADLIEEVGGAPLIIKLLEGTQGLGVVLAETEKAAQSVIEAFYGLKSNILVQEFIKEAGGSDVRAFVVNGKVVGAMKRQGSEGEFRSNLHRGGKGEMIKLSRLEKSTAIKAAEAMGLSVAGVDMLQSAKGPLILEVNSSPGLKGIEDVTGVDIAGSIIEYIEQNASKRIKDKVGV
jgi:ribosomal protein S6--L-glutamate ligase